MLCACVCYESYSLYRMDTFTGVAVYQYARAIFIACIDFTILPLIYYFYAYFYNYIRQFTIVTTRIRFVQSLVYISYLELYENYIYKFVFVLTKWKISMQIVGCNFICVMNTYIFLLEILCINSITITLFLVCKSHNISSLNKYACYNIL